MSAEGRQEERGGTENAATQRLSADREGISEAARLLQRGALVAFPTETVYGLGADATNGRAVAGVFAAKGRPAFNPLIAHVADLAMAEGLVSFTPQAHALASAFWPGPLTLVLPRRSDAVSELASAGLDTLAVRVPAHPVARDLLSAVGRPVAAPSANPSGRISPTTAEHVLDGLDGRIAAVLDGGACEVGLESTIVGWDGETPVLLRPGGVAVEALEGALGRPLAQHAGGVNAPGQLSSHYAPEARLRLNVEVPEADELWLRFGDGPSDWSLSPTGDLHEAAARLFALLRAADAASDRIAVAPIPDTGLGRAINDRLRRAAAPR
ncbi:L-threonylcarbamoyladenylate synthase [Pontivivens ytuae]|uniref:Threonylcarbamoyl-AMP synthase n=1 Tax=Pontivivens ytuae TaxID=2789856 RepID=A0A7S9QDX9_9RHOB|nr:L-threonylcarbamoyladenylate synthase [Pontivivens ytuae]QPH55758.1 threonylcarbamoyl-AMP synthase [Pontivivens ytuae]